MEISIIALPLIASIISGFFGKFIGDRSSEIITSLLVSISAVFSCMVLYEVIQNQYEDNIIIATWINSGTLIAKSVYGPSYGGERGPDNVDILGQGNFIFRPLLTDDDDIYFELGFSDSMHINGDLGVFTERNNEYAACFITTYRAGRNTETPGGTVPSTRTAIYPRRYRQSAIDIDTLS